MANNCLHHPSFFLFPRILWGTIAISAGLFLLGFNTGILPIQYKSIVFSVPFLIFLVGTIRLICRRHLLPSVVMIGIGLYFLSPKLGILHPDYSHWITPILLILLGMTILFRHCGISRRCSRGDHLHSFRSEQPSPLSSTPGAIHENRVFSGSHRRIVDEDFLGGEINCVFGGCELDLSKARLPEGSTRLDVNCVFGGVTLMVPDDWEIQIQVSSIFGDFQDRRRVHTDCRDENRVLFVTGSCVFGGGEIKYAPV